MKTGLKRIIRLLALLLSVLLICSISNSMESLGETENCYMDIKKVALTFDDGPNADTTARLLDGLKERNAVATFFVVGENADKNRELIERMESEGHLIGNHTNTHCNLGAMSCEMAEEEILKTNSIIYEVTGKYTEYLRPPFGVCGKTLINKLGMFSILWNVDPLDWSILNKERVVKHVVNHTKDGDIILLHDIFDTSVDAALEIVDILSAQGYQFVTVDEIIFP